MTQKDVNSAVMDFVWEFILPILTIVAFVVLVTAFVVWVVV